MVKLRKEAMLERILPFTGFYKRHQKYAAVVFFLVGFLYDSLRLTRIDRMFDNIMLLVHLLLLGALIVQVGRLQTGQIKQPRLLRYARFYPLAVQFFLGSLFSAYTVFYFQSVSLSKTAIFFGILVILLLANQFLKRHLTNLPFLITLYFFVTFSFVIFFIPVLTGIINRWVFFVGAWVSLMAMAVVLSLIYWKIFPHGQQELLRSSVSAGALLLLLAVFYVLNWIPPVPLSLKFGGVYHQVHSEGSIYYLTFEKPAWYQFWKKSEDPFRLRPGDRVYCFAAVFAPTALKTEIYQEWQRYDERRQAWVTTDRRGYTVTGGRGSGYRGYTYKQSISPGQWRVDVQTSDDRLLGRINFRVTEAGRANLKFVTIQK